MQESVTYQDILQKGVQQGLKQGEATVVIRQLQRRFGELPSSVITQIKALPLSQLEALADALLDFKSLTDLAPWLSPNLLL